MRSYSNSGFSEFDYIETEFVGDNNNNGGNGGNGVALYDKAVMFPSQPQSQMHSSVLSSTQTPLPPVMEQPHYLFEVPVRRPSVIKTLFHQPKTQEEIDDLSQNHSFVYLMLNPKCRKPQAEVFKKFISTVILLDFLAFVLSTEAALHDEYALWFQIFEGLFSSIFLVEYIGRIVTITENKRYGKLGPILGRLAWMVKLRALIDILATVPFFIQLATGWAIPHVSYVRVFRVLRILRTDGYVRAFGACYRVIYYNREILWVAVLVCMFLIVSSSVLLYYMRPRDDDKDFPLKDQFQSIPSTIFLSVLMLTGQDTWIKGAENMPWYTKLMVGLTGAMSVAMFAIPVSLLTWGFEAEAERCAKKARKEYRKQKSFAGSVASEKQYTSQLNQNQDNSHFAAIIQVASTTSDEEYQRIIAKETTLGGAVSGGGCGSDLDREIKREHLNDLIERYLRNDQEDCRKYYALAGFLANQCGDASWMSGSIHNNNNNNMNNNVNTNNSYTMNNNNTFSESTQEAMARDLDAMQNRMAFLESTVERMDSKLDKLCSLLTEQKQQQQHQPRRKGELT